MTHWREAIDSYINSQAERWCRYDGTCMRNPGAEPRRVRHDPIPRRAAWRRRPGGDPPSGRGLIAEPKDQGDRKRIAIRADIDALRIADAKSVPYRSGREGLMHACGHDAATRPWPCVPRWRLRECRDELPEDTAWRAVFQPAEEVSEGAIEM